MNVCRNGLGMELLPERVATAALGKAQQRGDRIALEQCERGGVGMAALVDRRQHGLIARLALGGGGGARRLV